MENLFTVVTWPESQELLEIEGFEEKRVTKEINVLKDSYEGLLYVIKNKKIHAT